MTILPFSSVCDDVEQGALVAKKHPEPEIHRDIGVAIKAGGRTKLVEQTVEMTLETLKANRDRFRWLPSEARIDHNHAPGDIYLAIQHGSIPKPAGCELEQESQQPTSGGKETVDLLFYSATKSCCNLMQLPPRLGQDKGEFGRADKGPQTELPILTEELGSKGVDQRNPKPFLRSRQPQRRHL